MALGRSRNLRSGVREFEETFWVMFIYYTWVVKRMRQIPVFVTLTTETMVRVEIVAVGLLMLVATADADLSGW